MNSSSHRSLDFKRNREFLHESLSHAFFAASASENLQSTTAVHQGKGLGRHGQGSLKGVAHLVKTSATELALNTLQYLRKFDNTC